MIPECPSCHGPLAVGLQVCPACGHTLSIPPPRVQGGVEGRRDERFTIPTDVRLRKLDSDGVPQKEERTIAHDLSRSGMRVLTSWSDLQEGDKVSIEEVSGGFATGAIVRHVKRGTDQITRAGIEFTGNAAPDRLVGTTTGIKRPAFSSVQSSAGSSGGAPNPPAPPPSPTGRSGSYRPLSSHGTPASIPPPPIVKAPDAAPPQAPRPIESLLEEIETARVTARGLVAESKIWEALDCLAKAQALAEGTTEARALRILTWETQAKVPSLMRAAHQSLEDLARREPGDAAVHSALGRIYWEAGLSARARAAFRQVQTLDPSNREATAALKTLGDQTPAR